MRSICRVITCFTRCARTCCAGWGANAEAAAAYQAAIEHCDNAREKKFLQRQYESIASN